MQSSFHATLTEVFTALTPDTLQQLVWAVKSNNTQAQHELSTMHAFLSSPQAQEAIVRAYTEWREKKPAVACVIDRNIPPDPTLKKLTYLFSGIGTCLHLNSEGLGRVPDLNIIRFLRHIGPTTFMTGDLILLRKIREAGEMRRSPNTPHPIFITAGAQQKIGQKIDQHRQALYRFATQAQRVRCFTELEIS